MAEMDDAQRAEWMAANCLTLAEEYQKTSDALYALADRLPDPDAADTYRTFASTYWATSAILAGMAASETLEDQAAMEDSIEEFRGALAVHRELISLTDASHSQRM